MPTTTTESPGRRPRPRPSSTAARRPASWRQQERRRARRIILLAASSTVVSSCFSIFSTSTPRHGHGSFVVMAASASASSWVHVVPVAGHGRRPLSEELFDAIMPASVRCLFVDDEVEEEGRPPQHGWAVVLAAQIGVLVILVRLYLTVRTAIRSNRLGTSDLLRRTVSSLSPFSSDDAVMSARLRHYGEWTVIWNATFDEEWTERFCLDLLRIFASSCSSSSSSSPSDARFEGNGRPPGLGVKILLIGEEEKDDAVLEKERVVSNEEGAGRSQEEQSGGSRRRGRRCRRSVKHLAERVASSFELALAKGSVAPSSARDPSRRRPGGVRIDPLVYPTIGRCEHSAPSTEEVGKDGTAPGEMGNGAPSSSSSSLDSFLARLKAKLGHILLDGGVGLCLMCPPTIADPTPNRPSSSSSGTDEGDEGDDYDTTSACDSSTALTRYLADSTAVLHDCVLPHMAFRNSGAVVQLLLAGDVVSNGNDEEGSTGLLGGETRTDDVVLTPVVRSAVAAYQSQLMRSMNHEYGEEHGIDCLTATVACGGDGGGTNDVGGEGLAGRILPLLGNRPEVDLSRSSCPGWTTWWPGRRRRSVGRAESATTDATSSRLSESGHQRGAMSSEATTSITPGSLFAGKQKAA